MPTRLELRVLPLGGVAADDADLRWVDIVVVGGAVQPTGDSGEDLLAFCFGLPSNNDFHPVCRHVALCNCLCLLLPLMQVTPKAVREVREEEVGQEEEMHQQDNLRPILLNEEDLKRKVDHEDQGEAGNEDAMSKDVEWVNFDTTVKSGQSNDQQNPVHEVGEDVLSLRRQRQTTQAAANLNKTSDNRVIASL